MFKEEEIEALVLGARIVQTWADCELAEAASNVIAKVEAVIPERLRSYMADTALLAPSDHFVEPIGFDIKAIEPIASQSCLKYNTKDKKLPARKGIIFALP